MDGEHVLVITQDQQRDELLEILFENGLNVTRLESMHDISNISRLDGFDLALIDLDMTCVSNNSIHRLKQKNADIWILGFSCKSYHPHLRESLQDYMFGVVAKPPNPDELTYCLQCLLGK